MKTEEEYYPLPSPILPVYYKAVELRKQNREEEAREILLGLLARYPEEPRLLNSVGNTYFSEDGDLEKAEQYYLKVLGFAPDFSHTLSNLSSLYSRTGRFEQAADYARRAIKAEPDSAAPWTTLGLYYLRKGETDIALHYFVGGYSRDNTYKIAAYNAACALSLLGRFDEALEYLEQAIVEKPLFDLVKGDADLEPMRDLPEFERLTAETEKRFSSGK